jgi:hypothetical protein
MYFFRLKQTPFGFIVLVAYFSWSLLLLSQVEYNGSMTKVDYLLESCPLGVPSAKSSSQWEARMGARRNFPNPADQ